MKNFNQTKKLALNLASVIAIVFFVTPSIGLAIYCTGNSFSNVGEYAGTSCPLGTHTSTDADIIGAGLTPTPAPTTFTAPQVIPPPTEVININKTIRPCYNRLGSAVAYTNPDGSCPAGTMLTNVCVTNPTPECLNYDTYTSPDGSFQSNWDPDAGFDLSGGTSKGGTSSSDTVGKFIPSDKGSGFIPSDKDIAETGFTALAGMINTIIKWFVGMSATIAAISFSIAGAQMLLHPEEESKLSEAKAMFAKTFWGILIVIGAWLIVNTIITTLVSDSDSALRFLK